VTLHAVAFAVIGDPSSSPHRDCAYLKSQTVAAEASEPAAFAAGEAAAYVALAVVGAAVALAQLAEMDAAEVPAAAAAPVAAAPAGPERAVVTLAA
jgi:hypothetical protein